MFRSLRERIKNSPYTFTGVSEHPNSSLATAMALEAKETNITYTENGDIAFKCSEDLFLDGFYKLGTSNGKYTNDIELVKRMVDVSPLNALLVMLYIRNHNGGTGRREIFKKFLDYLANKNTEEARDIYKVAFFITLTHNLGRLDDVITEKQICSQHRPLFKYLYILGNNKNYNVDMDLLEFLGKDRMLSLYKWLPREKSAKKQLARELAKIFGLNMDGYRKYLRGLKNTFYKDDLVETKLCNKDYSNIDLSEVPSRAFLKYRQVWKREKSNELEELLNSKDKGPKLGKVLPYDILKLRHDMNTDEVNNLWNKLITDGLGINTESTLPVVDVSGSMETNGNFKGLQLIDIAVTMGMYLAATNTTELKNTVMTFSTTPVIYKLDNKGFIENWQNIKKSDGNYSTKIMCVFNKLVEMVEKYNLKADQLPKNIVIFSDMQFDDCGGRNSTSEEIRKLFDEHGLEEYYPRVVYWNLDDDKPTIPATMDMGMFSLVSGFDPKILPVALGGVTPLDTMRNAMKEYYGYYRDMVNKLNASPVIKLDYI